MAYNNNNNNSVVIQRVMNLWFRIHLNIQIHFRANQSFLKNTQRRVVFKVTNEYTKDLRRLL